MEGAARRRLYKAYDRTMGDRGGCSLCRGQIPAVRSTRSESESGEMLERQRPSAARNPYHRFRFCRCHSRRTDMSSTKDRTDDKPSSLNQEPAEGSRETITRALERQPEKDPQNDGSRGAKPPRGGKE